MYDTPTAGGRVWHDLNANGIQDDGSFPEPPDIVYYFDEESGTIKSYPFSISSGMEVWGPGLPLVPEMITVPILVCAQGRVHATGVPPLIVGATAF